MIANAYDWCKLTNDEALGKGCEVVNAKTFHDALKSLPFVKNKIEDRLASESARWQRWLKDETEKQPPKPVGLDEERDSATTPPVAPKIGGTPATINARMIDLLGRKPEAKDWSARQFAMALDCSKGSIGDAAAWKTLMQTRESAKAARQTRSTFKDSRGKRRPK